VLKIIATFYDPIGLIQPIIVSLKILFQQICKTDCGWDDVIPDHLTKRWNEIVNELKNMDTVRIRRCYANNEIVDPIVRYELHGFIDASQQAYGACIYLTTKNILKKEIPIHQTIYWTDSKVTLAWIQSPKKEYKIFVENRLCSIRKQTEIPDWKFVGTNFNPADLITRFIKPASLIENEL